MDTAKLLTDKFNKQLPSSLEVVTSQPLTSQPLEDEEEEDERMEIVTVEESSSLTFYMRSSRDSPEPAGQGKNVSYTWLSGWVADPHHLMRIWIQLFTLMRIRIRIFIHIKVMMGIYDLRSIDPVPRRLYFPALQ